MQCSSCGREIPDNSKFCGLCGAPQPSPEQTAVYQPSSPPPPPQDHQYYVPPAQGYQPPSYQPASQAGYTPPSYQPPSQAGYAPPAYQPPVYGQPYGAAGARKAGFWIRFVALLIDGVILGVVSLAISLPLGAGFAGIGAAAGDETGGLAAAGGCLAWLLIVAIEIGYVIAFWTLKSATPGKMALGLKVVTVEGADLTLGKAILRFVGYIVNSIIPFAIGYIWAAFDSQKQGIHDKIAGTYVIYTR
ncbi:MAG: RDD family protein [Chloroflexi bacterium]|nr:RDD family protein [Chloroflexota bacterium]